MLVGQCGLMKVGQPHLIGLQNRVFLPHYRSSDFFRRMAQCQRKSMKLKRQHPVELAIKIESLSFCSGRKYSIRIREGDDFTSTFAVKEEAVRSLLKEVL
ncbi:hypothetical protein MRB53_027525 [Persea americana]|uniref:Uncharacterized protein n=1 Tax=Persea americana TaxID=3435 RepID=A0ACC2LL91_PERAE|nr:hypothetical protein MRB53_027525 [Persea americana]